MITTEGGRQSAATILEHEADHANDNVDNPHNHNKNSDGRTPQSSGYDSQYDTKEERRVEEGNETKTARANGEATRKDHRGTPYRTINPTSTEPYQ